MARSVTNSGNGESECVRLTRKLAEQIDGIDLSGSHVGDTLMLNAHDADLIVAEGWAERLSGAEGQSRKREPRRDR